jgi:hypothetical protein
VKREAEENWGNDESGARRRLKRIMIYDPKTDGRVVGIQKGSPNEARLARGTIEGSRAFEKQRADRIVT